jgi:hypothetical protein
MIAVGGEAVGSVARALDWELEPSEELVRPRPLRALTLPIRERRFTYDRYEALLDRLAASERIRVVPLREYHGLHDPDSVVVGIRHDIDERLGSALELARLEHERGLRSTYYVLHTAPYYGRLRPGEASHDESVIPALRALQDGYGHEVGWHNDLVTLQCVYGVDPVGYLHGELAWLRGHGLDVSGSGAHGSYWCHALGFTNNYFFSGLDEPEPGFPNTETVEGPRGRCRIAKARLADFGLEYEANHLERDWYFSDSYFRNGGERWHPDLLDVDRFRPGDRVIVLVHPCHWDRSAAAKWRRALRRAVVRGSELARAGVSRRRRAS